MLNACAWEQLGAGCESACAEELGCLAAPLGSSSVAGGKVGPRVTRVRNRA